MGGCRPSPPAQMAPSHSRQSFLHGRARGPVKNCATWRSVSPNKVTSACCLTCIIDLERFVSIYRRDDAMSGVTHASMNSLSNALVTEDTVAMIAWFDAHEKACSGAVGCVSHCMSGCYITTIAGRFPHRIKAAASLSGMHIATDKPDLSRLLLPEVTGELYYALAEHDQSVPAHVIP
jgi:dienelactone hydrolase